MKRVDDEHAASPRDANEKREANERRDADERIVGALSEAARRLADAGGPGPTPAAWHRLQQTRARQPSGVRRRLLPVAAVAALGVLGVVGGRLLTHRARPLTYVVDGGEVEANGYVRSVGTAGTELRFSDGTRVRLDRGARLSVGAPGAHGARLRVEDGQAHFAVTHLPSADWSVEAGPYRVQVTGTVFDVGWKSVAEAVTVVLHTGSVRVTGPHLAAPVTLEAGQRLLASLATGDVHLAGVDEGADEGTDEGADVPEARVAPAPPAAAPAGPTRAMSAAAEPPATTPHPASSSAPPRSFAKHPVPPAFQPASWAARVARGESAAVIGEARARSLDAVVADVDGPALAALADAARYSGERALSERVLGELRRRFPASPQAPTAAFLLGRMAEDRGDARAALALYRRYRAEAPGGPYVAEALGREMLVVERLSGRDAAAAIARAYLSRFPEGTYLLQARAILGLP